MQPVTRCVRLLGARGFASHAKAHVHMPETAMLTNNGTHLFERKGWEYSVYIAMLGAPVVLFLGLTNVPETDSEVFAREEALAKRAGTEFLVRRPSGPASQRYSFKPSEIGEPPMLEEEEE
ncbi:hypothetical protein PHYPSEUDO_005849 [Phytophthora pseudosyringae]|uniref:NADH dehydrogenase [ubiquinone] 1 beta subcomplex subunit 11, mitochondrial n=1 Tax=Phytophthora pseudosyringae TaxID=221518 RepID=A0A8T1WAP7_9STRA|nr:hypothetical protein PHYPSEUDO_005849 [Phytophthora pseudosyringae]